MFKLLKFLRPYKIRCLVLTIFIAIQTWCVLMLPAEMAKIINIGIAEKNYDYIFLSGAKMLFYVFISTISAIISGYLSAEVGAKFARDLREKIYKKVISFSLSDYDKFSTASLITRTTNDITQVQQTVSMMLTMMLRAPTMAILALIQALNTAQNMTWIIALAIGIILFSAVAIISSAIPKFKIFQKLFDRITQITRENLTGLRVVRAFNNQKIEADKFKKTNAELTKNLVWFSKVMGLITPLITLVFDGICLLCIWIGLQNYEYDTNYLGNMIAFMQYAIQVVMSFMILTFLIINIPRANVSASRINEVLHTRPKIIWKKETVGTPSKEPSVIFKNVDFSYKNAEDSVLSNINFEAKAGETTAIIGSTGSGKTTIANLILRFYDPTNGTILINNINIKNYSKNDLIKRIGYVPQRAILFSGSVDSNIRFGNKNLSNGELEEFAKISQSEEFIEKLPEKFSSQISQGGTNISGGQKQRLSIARALAKKPEIFLFDDSFSALDMKTDMKLRKELKETAKNSATIIIAQRVSTIKNSDQIIVLEKGKIVGKGTHSELLLSCKIYQDIVKSQISESEFEKELEIARRKK